ncbi:MAG: hypothetical protein H6684_16055 [Deltaproteobacteria bacterium]|nr:hypothetical protein [Deltaproteobacteria bacterium]MCB9490245.1 hypothetical protein [Deltaproteobacteria bacterium]
MFGRGRDKDKSKKGHDGPVIHEKGRVELADGTVDTPRSSDDRPRIRPAISLDEDSPTPRNSASRNPAPESADVVDEAWNDEEVIVAEEKGPDPEEEFKKQFSSHRVVEMRRRREKTPDDYPALDDLIDTLDEPEPTPEDSGDDWSEREAAAQMASLLDDTRRAAPSSSVMSPGDPFGDDEDEDDDEPKDETTIEFVDGGESDVDPFDHRRTMTSIRLGRRRPEPDFDDEDLADMRATAGRRRGADFAREDEWDEEVVEESSHRGRSFAGFAVLTLVLLTVAWFAVTCATHSTPPELVGDYLRKVRATPVAPTPLPALPIGGMAEIPAAGEPPVAVFDDETRDAMLNLPAGGPRPTPAPTAEATAP